MFDLDYTYHACVEESDEVFWKPADLLPEDARLDLGLRSMPESMVRIESIDFLSEAERLQLNHIAGNSYMNLLAQFEGAIIATSIKHAQSELAGEPDAARALIRVAEEEFKHRRLFERYCSAFLDTYADRCDTMAVEAEITNAVASRGRLSAVLVTLHLELATQWHFAEFFMSDDTTDAQFKRILEAHWRDECQHIKIDMLELTRAAAVMSDGAIDGAIHDYLQIVETLARIVVAQAELDVKSLARLARRAFSDRETAELIESRAAVYRGLFVVSGMVNPDFLGAVRLLLPESVQVVEGRAKAYAAAQKDL